MEAFFGKWKMKSMEGEKDLQDAVGIPDQLQEKFNENKLKMETEYEQEGDYYVYKLTPGPGAPPIVEKFKLGEQFESRDLLGVPTTVTVTLSDGVITENRKSQNYDALQYKSMKNGDIYTKVEIKGAVMTTVMEKI